MADSFYRRPSSDVGKDTDFHALFKAAIKGNLGLFKGTLNCMTKGDLSAIFSFNIGGVGVLHVAACAGHLNICQYLVEELGGDVNAPGCGARGHGATPFMKAAQSGDLPTVKFFFDHGGDMMKTDDKGRTILHHAAGTGSCEVTEFLLSRGMPVDLDCGRGTPLLMAAINEQDKTMKILLDHQANPNIITTGAGVPLLSALIYRSLKCVKLLIKAGADVNCNGSKITPLVFATMHGGYTKFIKVLLKAGADPNIPDDLGRLPIELAAHRNCKEEFEMLLAAASSIPNVLDCSIKGAISHEKTEKEPLGRLPIQLAAYHNCNEEVEMLLSVTTSIPNVPYRSTVGVISHAEVEDKKPIVSWKQEEEAGKTVAIADVTSEKGPTNKSPSVKSNYIQIFVVFGGSKIAVDSKLQDTVRTVVSIASKNLGVVIKDYYIVYYSKYLKLDDNLLSQQIISGSFLSPTCRLRGGVPQGITWKQPLVEFTHGFSDEIYDLCHIPEHGTSVCLDITGTTICCRLIEMVHRLFKKSLCAPNFRSSDIVFDHNTGSFCFRDDFEDFENITMGGFASSMSCFSFVIRRIFYFSPEKVARGEPVIRILAHGNDGDSVIGQLPDFVAFLVTDLIDVENIVQGANMDEIMDYLMFHIVNKTSHARLCWEIAVALHMRSYPGGYEQFEKFMERFSYAWFSCMEVFPLNRVEGFTDLSEMYDHRPTSFCRHTRNFVSHPEIHGWSQKQAEALVMKRAPYFLYQVARDMSLRIPKNIREGNTPAPVALPSSPDNVYAVNSYTTAKICQMW